MYIQFQSINCPTVIGLPQLGHKFVSSPLWICLKNFSCLDTTRFSPHPLTNSHLLSSIHSAQNHLHLLTVNFDSNLFPPPSPSQSSLVPSSINTPATRNKQELVLPQMWGFGLSLSRIGIGGFPLQGCQRRRRMCRCRRFSRLFFPPLFLDFP